MEERRTIMAQEQMPTTICIRLLISLGLVATVVAGDSVDGFSGRFTAPSLWYEPQNLWRLAEGSQPEVTVH